MVISRDALVPLVRQGSADKRQALKVSMEEVLSEELFFAETVHQHYTVAGKVSTTA